MQNAQQEKGHLYKAEKPNFLKGQTGKGVSIRGNVTAKKGSPLQIGDDSAKKIRATWKTGKGKKFPNF